MEIQNEDQTSTSSNSTSYAVPVEHIYFDGSQLSTASAASGSNESDTDQVSNRDAVAPLTTGVINDIDHEEDTGIRQQGPLVNGNQPPVRYGRQPSTNEDLSLKQAEDLKEKSHHYCCICTEYVYVQVNGSRQIAAHEACLDKLDLSHTDWNCFQRGRTVQSNDYSAPKQPSSSYDVSDTWEYSPQLTFSRHFEVLSLVCDFCKKEVVIVKSQCCIGKYHKECLNKYDDKRCPYCRRPTQEGGGRNGGGEDDIGSNGGGRGRGGGGGGRGRGRGCDGERVDDRGADSPGGGDGRVSDGEGGSEIMEGDESDRSGGGDNDGGGGGGGGGGSPSTSQPPQQLSYPQVLLLAHFFPELFLPHSGGDGEGGDGEGGDGEGGDGEGGDGGRRDGGRRDGGEGDGRVGDGEEGDDGGGDGRVGDWEGGDGRVGDREGGDGSVGGGEGGDGGEGDGIGGDGRVGDGEGGDGGGGDGGGGDGGGGDGGGGDGGGGDGGGGDGGGGDGRGGDGGAGDGRGGDGRGGDGGGGDGRGGDGRGGDGKGGDGGGGDGRGGNGEGGSEIMEGDEGDHEDGRDDDGDGGGSGGGSLLPVYHDLQEMEDSREILTNNQDDNEVATHGRRHTPVEGIHWDPTERHTYQLPIQEELELSI